MNTKGYILRKLFISTFMLSAFTFGGGYVIISLMKKKFVDEFAWINEEEMLDLVAIAQSAPGAIAVNGAIVIGYKLAGLLGILVSVIATILPPFIIITAISFFYEVVKTNLFVKLMLQGMQAGVASVIILVVYDMVKPLLKKKDYLSYAILILSFIAGYVFNVSAIYIILASILLGIVLVLWRGKQYDTH